MSDKATMLIEAVVLGKYGPSARHSVDKYYDKYYQDNALKLSRNIVRTAGLQAKVIQYKEAPPRVEIVLRDIPDDDDFARIDQIASKSIIKAPSGSLLPDVYPRGSLQGKKDPGTIVFEF